MTYAVQYDVPGDARIYARVKEAIGSEPASGLLVHLVVSAPSGGLRHIEVWEDQADYERFDRERVVPAVQGVLQSIGVTEPPPAPTRDELDLVDLHVPR